VGSTALWFLHRLCHGRAKQVRELLIKRVRFRDDDDGIVVEASQDRRSTNLLD
jgi:hypothetical protein